MKKLLLATLSLVFTFCMTDLQAQVCQPDTAFVNQGAGVYPLPDPIGSTTSSLATGCVNTTYLQHFTAVVPDSLFTEFSGVPIAAKLNSVTIDTITGLPDGITYACDPPDCSFLNQTSGCVIFSGTPTTEGTYEPAVITTVNADALNQIGIELPVNFPTQPGDAIDVYPGQYILYIREEGNAECLVSTENPLDEVLGVSQNVPNPFSSMTNIIIDSKVSGAFDFKVFSLIGKMVHNESINLSAGENTITFNGTYLNSGMYFYSIGQGNDIVTKRMIVNK